MLNEFSHKLQESASVIVMFLLACIASLFKANNHSFKTIISGIVFAGFVAYGVNLALMDMDLSENQRAVIVGCCAYLNRYVLDLLNAFADQVLSDPKSFLSTLKDLWSKR